jgi:exodeoxyribonuclease X
MAHVIRVIDFETTGMEPPAEVCEVGFCDVVNDGSGWTVGRSASRLCGVASMPPEVRAVHHISLAETAGKEPFDEDALWLDVHTDDVTVVAAHNLDFEAKFWGQPPVPLLCTYKAALRAWPEAPGHSNGVLRYWLEDQGKIAPIHDRTMPPHRAEPDAYVTAWLLLALLQTETAADMVRWTKEPRLLPTCPIGKFRGKPWPEVEGGFLSWMLNQPTMEEDLKWNARQEIERRRAVG